MKKSKLLFVFAILFLTSMAYAADVYVQDSAEKSCCESAESCKPAQMENCTIAQTCDKCTE